jgi:hypothetical protein
MSTRGMLLRNDWHRALPTRLSPNPPMKRGDQSEDLRALVQWEHLVIAVMGAKGPHGAETTWSIILVAAFVPCAQEGGMP